MTHAKQSHNGFFRHSNTQISDNILHLSGVCFQSGVEILKDITFSIKTGDILAIAGPNGAGKSTLLSIMSGLLKPTAGKVSLMGQELSSLSASERARKIAVVNQHDQTDLRLTIWDYVSLGRLPLRQHAPARRHSEVVAAVLEAANIANFKDKEFGLLSGGERQRAHIARALAQEPALLFLDEPTNHLDPEAKGKILSLISDLGISVVTILHDLALIPLFASHLAVLKSGHLCRFGTVEECLAPDLVRDVFSVDLLTLPHPEQSRSVYALDIPVIRNTI
ncbi:MAG: ABC transporter ATP-binding protein [Cohaesibacter sp.]|jgi:iron complex transport system ATP-binding protein|nr:ABC transporter ATP-binding protein [Cohaesibacter sp.]